MGYFFFLNQHAWDFKHTSICNNLAVIFKMKMVLFFIFLPYCISKNFQDSVQ